jgi:hypothetical protein
VPIQLSDGDRFAVAALSQRQDTIIGLKSGPGGDALSLLNSKTLITSRVRAVPKERYWARIDADDSWIVWVDAPDQYLQDWRLLVADYNGNTLREIAVTPRDAAGRPLPSPLWMPRIDHATVVWSVPSADPADGGLTSVYMVSLPDGGVREIAKNAAFPVISWPYVLYWYWESGSVFDGSGHHRLARFNISTGETSKINGIVDPYHIAAAGESIAWMDRSRKTLRLRETPSSPDTLIVSVATATTNYVQFPILTSRLLVWGQEGSEWVYDRKLKVRIQLNEHRAFGIPLMRGQVLAWEEWSPGSPPTGGQVMSHAILNVSSLP